VSEVVLMFLPLVGKCVDINRITSLVPLTWAGRAGLRRVVPTRTAMQSCAQALHAH
jgi:hypothetical protein